MVLANHVGHPRWHHCLPGGVATANAGEDVVRVDVQFASLEALERLDEALARDVAIEAVERAGKRAAEW